MNEIEMLLKELEDIVFEGKRKAFSDDITINRQAILAVIQDLKNALPEQMRDAEYIIKNRDKIVAEAEAKANMVLEDAHNKANKILDENEIIMEAEREAKAITGDAQRYLDKLELETRRSLQETIGECEKTLGDTINLLRNCREDLKGSLLTNEDK